MIIFVRIFIAKLIIKNICIVQNLIFKHSQHYNEDFVSSYLTLENVNLCSLRAPTLFSMYIVTYWSKLTI